MQKSKIPKIEYIQVEGELKEAERRTQAAYFILFNEVERIRRKKRSKKKSVKEKV